MKSGFLVLPILLSLCVSGPAGCAENINYSKVWWGGASVHVVSINLNSRDLKVTVSLAKNGRGSCESFGSMLNRVKPAAAVTGTFFCTRSLLPTGDVVIEGNLVHTGAVGTGICITSANTVKFVPYSTGRQTKWQGFETVLCGGPTLVREGQIYLSPHDQGFRDPALFGRNRRTGVGLTASNKLLFVAVDSAIQLRTLAKIMMHLGAVDAVSLDGGSSTALQCNGRIVNRPGRSLTNLLVVYGSLTDYCHYRLGLAPTLRPFGIVGKVKPIQTAMADETRLPAIPVVVSAGPIRSRDNTISWQNDRSSRARSSRRTQPVPPDAETVLNPKSKENPLTVLTINQVRRPDRAPELVTSGRLPGH